MMKINQHGIKQRVITAVQRSRISFKKLSENQIMRCEEISYVIQYEVTIAKANSLRLKVSDAKKNLLKQMTYT